MKKFISAIMAMALVLSMGVMSFASATVGANPGDLFEKNEDGRMESISPSSLIPGETYYVFVSEADNKPSKVSVKYECENYSNDKKIRILSTTNLSTSRKKTSDDAWGYFAELRLKTISASEYSDGDIVLNFEDVKARDKDNAEITFNGDVSEGASFNVEYETLTEIGETPAILNLDDFTDTFTVEGTDAEVEINSEGVKTNMLISCDTSYDASIGDKYLSNNLEFYYFNDAKARRPMIVTIPRNGANYLYEKDGSSLRDITKKDGDNFVFRTTTLGQYIISDKPMTTTPAVPTTPVAPTTPVVPSVPTPPSGGQIPFNPGTGAAC